MQIVGRDSAVGIATPLRVGRSGDRIPVGARFSVSVQTGPGSHPASYTMRTGSFLGGKAAEAWRWPPTLSTAEVKKRIELYLYSTSGPSWPVIGWTLPLPYLYGCRYGDPCVSFHNLLVCHQTHSVSNEQKCLLCELLHCHTEYRRRFCRGKTGVETMMSECVHGYEFVVLERNEPVTSNCICSTPQTSQNIT